jgi:DNA-binding CsgD family transcriptional regulator
VTDAREVRSSAQSPAASARMLIGRATERDAIDRLLAPDQPGRSGALVLRGEAGIGKTALLDYAAESVEGSHVVRVTGMESERELPFAGLHQLCASLLDDVEALPTPQREALATAFGIASGAQPDLFLVALAVLTLLSNAAEDAPLFGLVDDVQWLDRSSAQVLGFVARRLEEESVALLFAEREPSERTELARLPQLHVERLADGDARDLLETAVTAPLDDDVRAQILRETGGNPLALLELVRGLQRTDLAGGFGMPTGLSIPRQVEARFRDRVQLLPEDTRRLLLAAAADPSGEPALLRRTASALGIPFEAITPAESDGLIQLTPRITFRHPLLRSAVYGIATPTGRRAAHAALAAATDVDADPDRHAWHRSQATLHADEDVAAELERSAGRAQARGGLPAAAAFLIRAAALTPVRAERSVRALAAAEVAHIAGESETALKLLDDASAGILDDAGEVRVIGLRGQIALDLRHPVDAIPLLLDAAGRLESLDPDRARQVYGDALRAASVAGRFCDVADAARRARGTPAPAGAPSAADLLLDGLAVRYTDGYVAAAPALKRALRALLDLRDGAVQDARWPWFGRRVAADLFDLEAWRAFATDSVRVARARGALAVLPIALNFEALLLIFEGELRRAAAGVAEADAVTDALRGEPIEVARGLLAAYEGDEEPALALIGAADDAAAKRGEGAVLTFGELGRAVLYNGLGRYDEAVAPAESASAQDELAISMWALPELVESGARSERREVASTALARLAERTRAAGTDLALGVEARSRALLADADAAEVLYREAIERLGRGGLAVENARAHLLYGEWLRRERRRADAREQLRVACEMFGSMGAAAFAGRAGRELSATGAAARRRAPDGPAPLTAQELRVAELARTGLSNPEIGAQLFISPRTVEYHLHKVFGKLGITRRSQLERALGTGS